ncbi:MAG: response regulator, partial [Gammaproteobacteria bacterium]|nr:response regulator [Gammaproteobacteria bacterium]
KDNIKILGSDEPLLGIDLAVEYRPDLILLDINLPGIDGFEVLERLRENKLTCDIPVIAVSANAMQKDIEKGLEAGFDDYIIKPIVIKDLLRTVDSKLCVAE